MLTFLACFLFAQKITAPQAHIDFYTISTTSVQVELTVEAVAKGKDAPAEEAPKKIVRYFSWNAGATTGSDNSELARLVAQAMTEGGLEASSDGSETIINNASGVIVRSNHWLSLGAQVWATVPKEVKSCEFSVTFEPKGNVGKASLILGGAAKAGRPKVPEGDDGLAPADTKDPNAKAGDKPKAPPKATNPPKPADTKKKSPPAEIKVNIPAGTNAAALKELVTKSAGDASWKVETAGDSKFKILAAGDGAPRWFYARFVGEGQGAIGLQISAVEAEKKDPKPK